MNADLIVAGAIILIVTISGGYMILQRRKGVGSCGKCCGCSGCSKDGSCNCKIEEKD